MKEFRTYCKKNLTFALILIIGTIIALTIRIAYLMIFEADRYGIMAKQVHERERKIKAARGIIYDRNGQALASNKSVCTISVIHNQIKDEDKVVRVLSELLNINEEEIRKKVQKKTSMEKIKSNVDKKTGDAIREYNLLGVMVDEDYKRQYPYDELASKVIGFTGSDNQGIVGLEVEYEKYLRGTDGIIYTVTTAAGEEVENARSDRLEPVNGYNLYTSLDINIQKYAQQIAKKVCEEKSAKSVKLIVMNPQNGELYAMVNYPEYNLNNPYELNYSISEDTTSEEKNKLLNEMWRNACISDTYEPGSTFKIITSMAALEEKVVKTGDTFNCPGFRIVEDRRIRCHKVTGHGTETFVQGVMNSCNPVFMDIASRVGPENMYKYYKNVGLFQTTGVDVPGEANSIMHKLEDIGAVELATMSFGQSFQITPLQLLRAASAVINGGTLVTPHFGIKVVDADDKTIKSIKTSTTDGTVSQETSQTMREILEKVVSEGTGSKGQVKGYAVGGKTATSQKLPRGNGKYISSFIGFAPADNPQVIAIVLIDEPVGIYYGGTIAAPVISDLYKNILPYLNIPKDENKNNDKEN